MQVLIEQKGIKHSVKKFNINMYVEFLFIENCLRKTWFPSCKLPFAFIIRWSCPHTNKPAHSILLKMNLKLLREEHIPLFHWNSHKLKLFKVAKNSPPFYLSFFVILFYHLGQNVVIYSRPVSLLISYVYCEYPGALNYQAEKKLNFADD